MTFSASSRTRAFRCGEAGCRGGAIGALLRMSGGRIEGIRLSERDIVRVIANAEPSVLDEPSAR